MRVKRDKIFPFLKIISIISIVIQREEKDKHRIKRTQMKLFFLNKKKTHVAILV